MTVRLLRGDVLALLPTLPDDSVHCCVTSPPYWGLRSYLPADHPEKHLEIGSEPTVWGWLDVMVDVFREVRRVLRKDGTCFINIGDSYAAGTSGARKTTTSGKHGYWENPNIFRRTDGRESGFKPKDLIPQGWLLGLALQQDGWWLRQELIWAKKNPMPESGRDRWTKAHERTLFLTKGQWSNRTVKFLDLPQERVHFGLHVGASAPDLGARGFCVLLATAIFDGAQRKHNFGLPPFYSEEWKHVADGLRGDIASGLPPVQWAAAQAARLLCGDTTAEQFLRELNRFGCHLTQANDLLIGGRSTQLLLPPEIHSDRDGAIAIHHAGKIGKIEFLHERIVVSSPTTCNYYFDIDSIMEPVNGGAHPRRAGNKKPHSPVPGLAEHNAHDGVGRRQGPPGNPAENQVVPHDSIEARKARSRNGTKSMPVGERNGIRPKNNESMDAALAEVRTMRHPRSVQHLASEPFRGAHYATFPTELIRPYIRAGCPRGGVVLDPFGGSGTVGQVCDEEGRDAILIDLDERNGPMSSARIACGMPLLASVLMA